MPVSPIAIGILRGIVKPDYMTGKDNTKAHREQESLVAFRSVEESESSFEPPQFSH